MKTKITHIGIAVFDLETSVRVWTENFGFKEIHRVDIEAEGFRTVMLSPNGVCGEMAIELIEPMDKSDNSNAVARYLARNGEGFYHLGMVVGSVAACGAEFERKSTKVVRLPPAPVGAALQGLVSDSSERCVIHPKATCGVLIELLQSCA